MLSMIYGNLQHTDAYAHLLVHPVWKQAFDWLKQCKPDVRQDTYQLRDKSLFVIVQNPETLPRERCRFESHRKYLDIQYCISGGEVIDWESISRLQPDGSYNTEKDILFYLNAAPQTSLFLRSGDFAIFHPSDAHRPLVNDGANPRVLKAVVKVQLDLLA